MRFMRRAYCGLAGLWLAGGAGGAVAQTAPPPSPPVPKVYTPTISPMPGQPQQPPPQPWNNTQPTRQQYAPPNPVVPASAAAPAAPPAVMPRPVAPPAPPPALPPMQTPSVVVEKRGPEVVNFGQPLVYEILVRNTGQATVFDVRVIDEVPAGVRYLGGEPMAEAAGNKLFWPVGVLEAGGERRVRVELQPPGEG